MIDTLPLNLKIQNKILGFNKKKSTLFAPLYLYTNFSLFYIKNLVKHLRLSNSLSYQVLDAGCGRGFLSCYLASKFPHSTIFALDNDNEKIDFIKNNFASRFRNIKVVKENLLNIQSSNKFNIIFLIDVLEHIRNDVQILKQFYGALQKKGKIVIHTTSDIFKAVIFRSYFTNYFFPDHVRNGYKKDILIKILETIGFKIKYSRYTVSFWGTLAFEFFFLFVGECFWLRNKPVKNNTRVFFVLLLTPVFILIYPFIFLLFLIDVWTESKWGNGILIVAEKQSDF